MLCVTTAAGQEVPQDSAVMRLMGIAEHLNSFGNMVPQEKVYLHLDNTSYYHGDNIWFAAYVVSAFDNRPEVLSRTLYVELLDPGGVVVERRVLPIDKGRCHGEFSLTQLPFRTGYYEVRAYTKYMLNFDSRGIFSRVIPVFDSPAVEGDYADRRLARYDDLKYEMKRPRTPRERNVSMRFYPEGGHLVTGLPSRVAFEATDGAGQPLDVAGGRIVGADGSTRTTDAASLTIRPLREMRRRSPLTAVRGVSRCPRPRPRVSSCVWITSRRPTACVSRSERVRRRLR